MSRKARTWAAAAALLLLIAGGTLAFGQVTGTFAIFTADVENQNNVLVGGWVPQPTALSSASPTSSPYQQVTLSWTPGGSPPLTGQTVLYADGGTGGSASCGTYSSFSSLSGTAASTSVTGTDLTHWWCFELTASASNWTTDPVVFTARRIFVPSGTVTLNNHTGGTAGMMENGDTIVIPYNQSISVGSSVSVQSCTAGTVLVGASTCAATPTVGTISGLSVSKSYTWGTSTTAGNGTSTLTITLAGSSKNATITGTGTFTASGSGVTSSGGQNPCSSATCAVAASGDF